MPIPSSLRRTALFVLLAASPLAAQCVDYSNDPAGWWVTDENGGCPLNYARMISVESEMVPIMVGAFSIPDNHLDQCFDQAITEPNGDRRRQVAQQNHNPTVFKNLVFIRGTVTVCGLSTFRSRRRRAKSAAS
jgi:hypothetical protein